MEDNKQKSETKWVRVADATDIYTNLFYVNWSMVDVRVRFGQMIPKDDSGDKGRYVVEERAAITMSWATAKNLRNVLEDALKRYEQANGPIDLDKLKLPS